MIKCNYYRFYVHKNVVKRRLCDKYINIDTHYVKVFSKDKKTPFIVRKNYFFDSNELCEHQQLLNFLKRNLNEFLSDSSNRMNDNVIEELLSEDDPRLYVYLKELRRLKEEHIELFI